MRFGRTWPCENTGVLAYGSPGLMMLRPAVRSRRGWGGCRSRSSRLTGMVNCNRSGTDAAAVVGMAVTAIGVQVGSSPLKRFDLVIRARAFVRASRRDIERRQGIAIVVRSANVSCFRESDELVATVGPWTVQLLGEKCQRILRLVAVARHALTAALELPHARVIADGEFLSVPSAGTNSRRSGRLATRTYMRAIHAVVVQQLRFQPSARQGERSREHRILREVQWKFCSRQGRGLACPSRKGWRMTPRGRLPSARPSLRPAIGGC